MVRGVPYCIVGVDIREVTTQWGRVHHPVPSTTPPAAARPGRMQSLVNVLGTFADLARV
jgi:hypothetical protein